VNAGWTAWLNTEPGLACTGTDAFALNGLARVPGRRTVWDSLIARYR
jgi:hypothetical protein